MWTLLSSIHLLFFHLGPRYVNYLSLTSLCCLFLNLKTLKVRLRRRRKNIFTKFSSLIYDFHLHHKVCLLYNRGQNITTSRHLTKNLKSKIVKKKKAGNSLKSHNLSRFECFRNYIYLPQDPCRRECHCHSFPAFFFI